MIRPATFEDIPAMVGHARKFFADLPIAFSHDRFEAFLAEHIGGDEFGFFVSERGSAGVLVTPHFASSDVVGSELWVWSEDRQGLAFIKAMEGFCRNRGATLIGVTAQCEIRGETVARLYERQGYQRQEIFLRKELA